MSYVASTPGASQSPLFRGASLQDEFDGAAPAAVANLSYSQLLKVDPTTLCGLVNRQYDDVIKGAAAEADIAIQHRLYQYDAELAENILNNEQQSVPNNYTSSSGNCAPDTAANIIAYQILEIFPDSSSRDVIGLLLRSLVVNLLIELWEYKVPYSDKTYGHLSGVYGDDKKKREFLDRMGKPYVFWEGPMWPVLAILIRRHIFVIGGGKDSQPEKFWGFHADDARPEDIHDPVYVAWESVVNFSGHFSLLLPRNAVLPPQHNIDVSVFEDFLLQSKTNLKAFQLYDPKHDPEPFDPQPIHSPASTPPKSPILELKRVNKHSERAPVAPPSPGPPIVAEGDTDDDTATVGAPSPVSLSDSLLGGAPSVSVLLPSSPPVQSVLNPGGQDTPSFAPSRLAETMSNTSTMTLWSQSQADVLPSSHGSPRHMSSTSVFPSESDDATQSAPNHMDVINNSLPEPTPSLTSPPSTPPRSQRLGRKSSIRSTEVMTTPKAKNSSPSKRPKTKNATPPSSNELNGIVEHLLACRYKKVDGAMVLQYLVKWLGFDNDVDNTWEPYDTLVEDIDHEFFEEFHNEDVNAAAIL